MPIDDDVPEDIRQIRNDLERVRQDIDSINRVQVISNKGAILEDVKQIVGKSKAMVAALFLTEEGVVWGTGSTASHRPSQS